MRDGGLANCKPRMLVGINQRNTNSLLTENGGEQRTREAIAEYSYIKIVFDSCIIITLLLIEC